MRKRIAAIDIGTNSVLLTIAEMTHLGSDPKCVIEAAMITRLGEGLTASKMFKTEAIERTVSALKKYTDTCRENAVGQIYVVGTEALRKAENSDEFIGLVKKECGLLIEIISGEREAELSFRAVERDFGRDVIVVDIGGGSTEFIFPAKNNELNVTSLTLGCVTLYENHGKSNPISKDDFEAMLHHVVAALRGGLTPLTPTLSPVRRGNLIATAGTATTLAAMKLKLKEYSHDQVHGLTLSIDDIERIIEDLRVRTIEQRKKLPGLEPARADVILPGALILRSVMDKLGFDKVTVSDRGVRWGVIYEKLAGFL